MSSIKIVLADDHVLVRDGIKALLEDEKDVLVIDEASNGEEALEVLKNNTPDLLIVDIRMPKKNGIEVVKIVKETYKDLKALVLSMHDSEEYVVQAIEAGADGYLLKGASKEEFLKALYTIASGGKYFSGDISTIIMNNFVNGNRNTTTSNEQTVKDPFNLTKREKQILNLIIKLKNNKEIAEKLEISVRTTQVHRFNLMKKLAVKNIKELSDKASKYNLI
ncbi:MAG: response regulator transcription factor [Flavobacterium sp.]|nr:response regulator transcription factor [Flavobacterium sp.]